MKKKQALKKLNELISTISYLPPYDYSAIDYYNSDDYFRSNEFGFDEWHQELRKAIGYIFIEDKSLRLIALNSVGKDYDMLDGIEPKEKDFLLLYKTQMEEKEALIKKYIKEIEEYWTEDEPIEVVDEVKHKENSKKGSKEMIDVFISHISEEKNVALVLKEWIDSTFLGHYNVFVSNDDDCINIGDKWLEQISNAIDESKVLIAICSAASMPRPWINFEIGCAYSKKIPIMPICHSGMTKSTLPSPISEFQGINLDSEESLERLFKGIAKNLDIKRLPKINYQDMLNEINNALGTVSVKEEIKVVVKEEIKEEVLYGKKKFCENILKVYMYENLVLTSNEVAGKLRNNLQLTQHYLDKMVEDKYFYSEYLSMTGYTYTLAPKGRGYMIENGIIT